MFTIRLFNVSEIGYLGCSRLSIAEPRALPELYTICRLPPVFIMSNRKIVCFCVTEWVVSVTHMHKAKNILIYDNICLQEKRITKN